MQALLIPICLLILGFCAGAPQSQDPNDDVEVLSSGPVSTNDYDDYGGFGGFGGRFPGFIGSRPRVRVLVVPVGDDSYNSNSFGLGGIFRSLFGGSATTPSVGSDASTDSVDYDPDCGPICTLIDSILKTRRTPNLRPDDRDNEISGVFGDYPDSSEDGFDINNSTHTTKVLADGTVVNINKTVISDTDEDGNTFFFQSVIHTSVNDATDKTNDANGEDEPEISLDTEDKEPGISSEFSQIVQDEGIDEGLKQ